MAKILIVDDEPSIRRDLKEILEEVGHKVAEASNASQAINVEYINFSPDLVTMDIEMPGMDGIKAVEKIITQDEKAKIIMVSTEGQKSNFLNAIEKGAKSFIVKPFNKEDVLAKVEEVLAI